METKFYTKTLILIITVLTISFPISCVYYNTFYNAEKYFKEAETIRLENEDRSLPINAQTSYTKVIEKCDIVIEKYSDSEYIQPALLLSSQAHYHKEEYNSSENKLLKLKISGNADYNQQADFWLALIKWKKGKIQPAIDQLSVLLNEDLITLTPTLIHLYIADIFIELKVVDSALEHLESAATKTTDYKEKGRIYQRLSELAFKRKEYDRALFAYEQVIKNSMVKKLKQDAHLNTAKIHRLMGNYDIAVQKIKSLLIDEDYKTLFGELELELVRIYEIKNELDASKERLQAIIKDYPSTEVSAEAYFMLGKKSIKENWDMKTAKDYFEKSNKENRKSPYLKESQELIKQINNYNSIFELIFSNRDSVTTVSDSLKANSASGKDKTLPNTSKDDEIAKNLILLSELEAFRFLNPDSAIKHLNMFLETYTYHELLPKAIYMLYFIYKSKNNLALSDSLGVLLTTNFSESEFAESVRSNLGIIKTKLPAEKSFINAENLWYSGNQVGAIDTLKHILKSDTTSDFSLRSGYFLGHQYDYVIAEPDSALKYYSWVETFFPEAEQTNKSKSRIGQIKKILAPTDSTEAISAKTISSAWATSPGDFESNASMTGNILYNDVRSEDSTDIIAAFVGDECRGVKTGGISGPAGLVFGITLYGTNGDVMSFRSYDSSEDMIYDICDFTYTYKSDEISGSFVSPVSWNFTLPIDKGQSDMTVSTNIQRSDSAKINYMLSNLQNKSSYYINIWES